MLSPSRMVASSRTRLALAAVVVALGAACVEHEAWAQPFGVGPFGPPRPLFAPPDAWGNLEEWLLEQRVHSAKDTDTLSGDEEDLELALPLGDAVAFKLGWEGHDELGDDASWWREGADCDLALGGDADLQHWAHELWYGAAPLIAEPNGHTDKIGRWVDYLQIARRWDRPERYSAYRYPVPSAFVVSGYDLDKPDAEQRRGKMKAVGHGGVNLVEKMGTPIVMLPLDHQVGDAEVLYTGPLFGETVITLHTRREAGKKRDYVLLYGHLDRVGDGLYRGRHLRPGEVVGYVGNSDSPELVHLHLEARRVKEGVDPWKLGPRVMDSSIVCDPRNVLPLRAVQVQAKCAPRLVRKRAPVWLARALTEEPAPFRFDAGPGLRGPKLD